jgi:hypothetical protein
VGSKTEDTPLTLVPSPITAACLLTLSALTPIARAAATDTTPNSYQRGLERLRGNQVQINRVLQRFGIAPLNGAAADHGGHDDSKKPSLFQIHDSLSQAQISPGKLYFGKTITRLIVGSDASPALVQLDPGQGFASGLRVMGTAKAAGTQGRVAIEITRLLLRGGRAVSIQGSALDIDGALGLPAQVISGKALAIGGAMATSFISGLAASQQTETANPFGFSQVQPTGRNALLQGVAQSAADQSKRLIGEATSEKPILIIEAETPVTILIQEEVKF